MDIIRENIDELNAVIKLTIVKEDYEARVAEVLKDYQKKAQMPGFRPGKVPAGLIKKMYGTAILVDEINHLVSKNLSNHLVEEKLDILGEPLPSETQEPIDFDKDEKFEFSFDIALAPAIELNLTKRDKIPFYTVTITDDLVDGQIKNLTSRFGENKVVEKTSEKSLVKGSIVQLDKDGSIVEGGIFTEETVLSSNIIKDEEVKKQFVGKAVGNEVVFDIKKAYPNDTEISYILSVSKEEAANVSGNFKLTIKEITEFIDPELNQELFDKMFGPGVITSEEEMIEKVRKDIENGFLMESDYRFSIDASEKLKNKIKVEFPEAFLKRWLKLAANKENPLSDEEIEKEMPRFIEDLKWQLIKNHIIKTNELKVENDDVVAYAKQSAKAQFMQYGLNSIPDEYIDNYANQMLQDEKQANQIAEGAINEKVMAFIKEAVKLDEKEISREDFNKLFEEN